MKRLEDMDGDELAAEIQGKLRDSGSGCLFLSAQGYPSQWDLTMRGARNGASEINFRTFPTVLAALRAAAQHLRDAGAKSAKKRSRR